MKIAFTACVAIFGIIAATLLLAPQAEAGLVEDLRSGKSDVRAAHDPSSFAAPQFLRYLNEQKSARDFHVTVTWRNWIQNWHGEYSAEAAIASILQHCEKRNRKCRVYAVGMTVVTGYSQKKLADAIEAYNLKVSASINPFIYCRNVDGSVDRRGSNISCGYNGTQITKSEYKRLKDRKTNTEIDDNSPQANTDNQAEINSNSIEAKLEKLKGLLDKGLITAEEAKAKRAKLLDDL